MPLRVAEKDGFLYAVNGCGDCPFHSMMLTGIKDHLAGGESPSGLGCFHDKIVEIDKNILTLKETKKGRGIKPVCIPVWCPLPNPLDVWLYGSYKTATETMILEESKLRGKHPETIQDLGDDFLEK